MVVLCSCTLAYYPSKHTPTEFGQSRCAGDEIAWHLNLPGMALYNLIMRELDRVRVGQALASLRSAKHHVFGAEAHGFDLNPVLNEAVVTTFERAHGVRLPSDYRAFLTTVGNGGAGPFYGIFPLGKVDDGFALRDWTEGDIGVLSKAFPFNEEWNDLSTKPGDDLVDLDEVEYWKQMETFERSYWSVALVNGAFPICHQGCALRILLVVTGDQAGNLWDDRRSEYGGIKPIRLADGSKATFADWYREWLEGALNTPGPPVSASP